MSSFLQRVACWCLLASGLPAASAMDFSDLEQTIADRSPRSIEELLPSLPADLRSRYVLMFRSRSLHGASFSRPRAILFSRDARFVVSFNGEPGLAGFRALETMQFDETAQAFEFREIEFPDPADRQGPPRISEPNPARCIRCHGEPARPIWDTHPVWPGAYGESFAAGLTSPERDGLRDFLRDQPTHPRYRHLLRIDRFANLETFRPTARERYEGEERLPPNGELGEALGRLNFRAIVHQLESSPQYDAYRYVLLAALGSDCGNLDAFFPANRRSGMQPALEEFSAESGQANAEQARVKVLRSVRAGDAEAGRYAAAGDIESLDRFRFVVEYSMGVSTTQWTTALEKGSYDFTWSPSALTEMTSYLRRRIAQADPEVAVLADLRAFNQRDAYCAHLRLRSRASLASLPRANGTAEPLAPDKARPTGTDVAKAMLGRCAGCHAGGVGPALPFDREAELTERLRSGPFPHGTLLDEIRWRLAAEAGAGRMPLGVNISEADRAALLGYLEELARRRPAP
jgi:mono/diheme cytochrome c family protein